MDEEVFIDLVMNQKRSNMEIADELGISRAMVSYYAKKLGLKFHKRLPTKGELLELYVNQKKSRAHIAKAYKISFKTLDSLLAKHNIPKKPLGTNQFNEITIEEVRKLFSESGYKLLSTTYVNTHSPLEFICPNHHEHSISFTAFRRGQRCKLCYDKNRVVHNKHTLEYVQRYFEKQGCELLSKQYNNSFEKLNYICWCGKEAFMSFSNFQKGYGCAECKRDRFKGANNHNYNPDLTKEERMQSGRYEEGYKEFRRRVFRRDKFRCVVCEVSKSGTLVAHHLESYSNNKELRTVAENAVTLCETCHKEFHGTYGYGNNTRSQFEEYIKLKQEG